MAPRVNKKEQRREKAPSSAVAKARRPAGQAAKSKTGVVTGVSKRKRPIGENNQPTAKRARPLTAAEKKKAEVTKKTSKVLGKKTASANGKKASGALVDKQQIKNAMVKKKDKALPRLVTELVTAKAAKNKRKAGPANASETRVAQKDSVEKKAPAKRGPGRPKKSDQASNAQDTAVKRGRGRPPKKLPKAEPETEGEITKNATKGSQKGAAKRPPPTKAKYLEKLDFDGTFFEVGDYVYIKKTDGDGAESDEELEECRICGRCPLEGEDMLECDTCLGGFHLGCLDPPLESIPEGDWNCPACSGADCGEWAQRERQRPRTARERFLAGELYMARINMIWKDASGEAYFRGNWLDIPEETHMGRREHNHRREVFLSTLEDDISMDSIIRHAWVLPRHEFERATNEGDDVYLLEYGYCPRNQRYKRIDEIADDGREWNAELSENDAEFQPSDGEAGASGSEDFSADEELEPRDKKRGPGRPRATATGTKRKRNGTTEPRSRTLNARRQRLEALAQLGAREIPAAARKRKLTKLEAAQAALTLAALPKKLSCRDKERQQVTSFVEEAVSAGTECLGSCLYISGVPGTGKTATVLEVMRGLRQKVDAKELPPFQFVEINALRVPSPAHVYSSLHEALTGEYLGPKNALERLQQRFSTEPRGKTGLARRPLVVLVDELDLLVTRNQSVLYNIFDWPTLPHSRLIVIGIANTIDLPERMLPRIASRMGLRRVAFNPYTREQLQEIVANRLAGIPAFRPEAIELASRKVASASGDVRRALELCRRAAEFASARQKETLLMSAGDVTILAGGTDQAGPSSTGGASMAGNLGGEDEDVLVELGDVDGAVKEMFDSPHIKSIERYSRHEQILLLVLVSIMRRTGIAETNFAAVTSAHIDMCRGQGELPPSYANLAEIVSRLCSSHVLICEPGSKHRLRKIELNVPSDDVTFALKRSAQVTWLRKLAEQRS